MAAAVLDAATLAAPTEPPVQHPDPPKDEVYPVFQQEVDSAPPIGAWYVKRKRKRRRKCDPIPTEWPCEHCGAVYYTAGGFRRHVLDKHSGSSYKCPHCDYVTCRRTNIVRHIELVHKNNQPMRVPCPECGKALWDRSSMRRHLAQVHCIVKCDQCEEEFTDKKLLREHKASVHPRESRKRKRINIYQTGPRPNGPTFCRECDLRCINPKSLKIHNYFFHDGPLHPKCPFCACYVAMRNLLKHVEVRHEHYLERFRKERGSNDRTDGEEEGIDSLRPFEGIPIEELMDFNDDNDNDDGEAESDHDDEEESDQGVAYDDDNGDDDHSDWDVSEVMDCSDDDDDHSTANVTLQQEEKAKSLPTDNNRGKSSSPRKVEKRPRATQVEEDVNVAPTAKRSATSKRKSATPIRVVAQAEESVSSAPSEVSSDKRFAGPNTQELTNVSQELSQKDGVQQKESTSTEESSKETKKSKKKKKKKDKEKDKEKKDKKKKKKKKKDKDRDKEKKEKKKKKKKKHSNKSSDETSVEHESTSENGSKSKKKKEKKKKDSAQTDEPTEGEKSKNKEKKKRIKKKSTGEAADQGDKEPMGLWYLTSLAMLRKRKGTEPVPDKFECELCQTSYSKKSSYRRHILDTHSGSAYACPHCHKIIARRSNLMRHIDFVHKGVRPERVKCDQCDRTCWDKFTLRKHVDNFHAPCTCRLCGQEFPDRGAMKQHSDEVHSKKNKKKVNQKKENQKKENQKKENQKKENQKKENKKKENQKKVNQKKVNQKKVNQKKENQKKENKKKTNNTRQKRKSRKKADSDCSESDQEEANETVFSVSSTKSQLPTRRSQRVRSKSKRFNDSDFGVDDDSGSNKAMGDSGSNMAKSSSSSVAIGDSNSNVAECSKSNDTPHNHTNEDSDEEPILLWENSNYHPNSKNLPKDSNTNSNSNNNEEPLLLWENSNHSSSRSQNLPQHSNTKTQEEPDEDAGAYFDEFIRTLNLESNSNSNNSTEPPVSSSIKTNND